MSKNFENEYIALAQTEVPDLWERIEAGLTPKSAQNSEKSEASIIDFKNETVPQKEDVKSNHHKAFVPVIKKYKTVLAAAVCVLVILPAVVILGQLGSGGAKEESAASDTAAAESAEYTVTTEAAETTEYTVTTEAAFEESAVYEEAAAEESMDFEEALEMERAAEEGENVYVKEAAKEEALSTADAKVADYAVTLEDGVLLNKVKIRVFAGEETEVQGEDKETGNLYRVVVLEDEEGLLESGEEIWIFVSQQSLVELSAEEIYTVTLEYDSTREYPFYLKASD